MIRPLIIPLVTPLTISGKEQGWRPYSHGLKLLWVARSTKWPVVLTEQTLSEVKGHVRTTDLAALTCGKTINYGHFGDTSGADLYPSASKTFNLGPSGDTVLAFYLFRRFQLHQPPVKAISCTLLAISRNISSNPPITTAS
ncbi:hypothetical protein V496_01428 [Pseudogymnoascus sp. VKM F-4515 (FW-2607)]|nr:hypothetical protein V496_01428 [Pseudogymnoascus sp. VKM F-4515 (FW-2607)]